MTKSVLVDCSVETAGTHWEEKIAIKWNIRNETCPDIIKLKHVRNDENVIVCKNRNKSLCAVRQMMQSAKYVPAGQLKNVLVDQLRMLFCTK